MSPERWQRLQQLFSAAKPLAESARQVFLAAECADDTALRREVEQMLAEDARAGDGLDSQTTEFGLPALNLRQKETMQMPILQPGARFGVRKAHGVVTERYEVVALLDTGGMGEVYLARDLTLSDSKVAVKVLRADKQGDEWLTKRFLRDEAHSVHHPNVARVLDSGRLPTNEPFLVMEFVSGQTLWHRINDYKTQDRHMPLAEVAEIVRQAGRGVAALHKANLVHRDLKPHNIMVYENPDTGELLVKIIDLGVVRDLSHSTALGRIAGTPYYMSPEQLHGQDVTPASDVYALGVVTYQMLTNLLPFNGENIPQVMAAQKAGVAVAPCALRPKLPCEAQAVLLEALSYDAPDRRRAAHQFGDDLATLLTTTTTPPPTPSRKWLIAVALLIVLAVSWGIRRNLGGADETPPQPTPTPDARPERALTYWLTVTRQDGKTLSVTGQEMFDTHDEFFFNFRPAQAGALYVFNEGAGGSWNILFPTPKNNAGEARLPAQQTFATQENVFTAASDQEKGTEKFWLVWAAQPQPELETIVRQSFKTELRVTPAAQQDTLRQFMASHATPTATADKAQANMTLTGRDEILIHQLTLEHKDWK